MPKPKRKKLHYEVMLTSIGVHSLIISGYSPEDACKRLQRRIAGKPIENTSVESKLVTNVWSEPLEDGDVWLLAPAGRVESTLSKVMTWDGENLKTQDAKNIVWSRFVISVTKT